MYENIKRMQKDNCKKIGRSAYLISVDGNKIVYKEQPPVIGLIRKVNRIIFGGSLPFRNEKRVNYYLREHTFLYLHYPLLINSPNDYTLEYEYIEGEDITSLSEEEISSALNGLLEFNSIGRNYSIKGIEGFAIRMLESPVIRTIHIIMKSDLLIREKLAGFGLLLSHCFRAKTIGPVLLHNDLQFTNLRRGYDGYIYLIDFEDAVPISRMILSDAVNILFDIENSRINVKQLREYWIKLAQRLKCNISDIDLSDQLRVCLLHLTAAGRQREASTPKQRCRMNELYQIILDKKSFTKWCQQQELNDDETLNETQKVYPDG